MRHRSAVPPAFPPRPGPTREARFRDPEDPETLRRRGVTEWRAGRAGAGAELIRRAIRLRPGAAAFHNDLGMVLSSQGQTADAAAALRRAVALHPDYVEALNNLGTVLRKQGKLSEAVAAYRRAVLLRPDFVEAQYNLANALRDLRQHDQAIELYRRAISLRPSFAQAWSNLGVALKDVGLLGESVECTRRALSLRPDLIAASNLICTLQYCDDVSPQQILEEHRQYQRTYAKPFAKLRRSHGNDRSSERKLRIGYVSPDLSSHPVGCAMLPVLRHRDGNNFEIVCYSDTRRSDEVTRELAGMADIWRETASVPDEQLAGLIQADAIDILIDLAGHTNENRLPVFARRPAPVQMTWLGWPGTTGIDAIDYRLSDRYLDPVEGIAPGSSESVVWLANGFLPFEPPKDAPDSIGELPAQANGYVTFGCFNNFCKVTGRTLALWAGVLGAVERSRMVMVVPRGQARERILERMHNLGVSGDRLDFLDRQSYREYLETYRRVDVVLDTAPFNGYATSLDALWMGVPVVTLAGQIAAHRGGASLLSNVGLSEWVARTDEQYLTIAARWAGNVAALARLRAGMRERLSTSGIMSGRHYVADLEGVLREMWREWCGTQDTSASRFGSPDVIRPG